MIKRNISVNNVIDLLNEALNIDREAITKLIDYRVSCNKTLADHKSIQVQDFGNEKDFKVGILGILNGIFGIDSDGNGPIAAYIDEDLYNRDNNSTFIEAFGLNIKAKMPPDNNEVSEKSIYDTLPCPRRNEVPDSMIITDPSEDHWINKDGLRTCSYCGSLHPKDFEDLLDKCVKGEYVIEKAIGKEYKFYIRNPKDINTQHKFYIQHIPNNQEFIDRINKKYREFVNG